MKNKFKKKKFNNNNNNNKKKGNSTSTSTSTTKKLYTIEDVRFDIGDAKQAANITNNMKTLISHIRTSLKYGEYRQEIADAIENEKYEEPEKPKYTDSGYKNTIVRHKKSTDNH